jgi:hypothetical protein
MIRKFARLVGAATASMAMLALPAATAVAASQPVTIQIAGTAKLQSDGSAVVTITYSCLPGFGTGQNGAITGDLEQTQGFGTASQTAICDDQNHTTTLDMAPGPFVPGVGAASVTIGNGVNEDYTQQAEVNIQR